MFRFRILIPAALLMLASVACSMGAKSSSQPPRPTTTPVVIQITSTPASTITVTAQATISNSVPVAATVGVSNSPTRSCTPPAGWVVYRVVSGDILSVLAERVGTTTSALTAANCLADASLIAVGQTLYLPSLPPAPAAVSAVQQPVLAVQTTACPLAPRLSIGGFGRYVVGAPANVGVYPTPGFTSSQMASVIDSNTFTVLAGPQCLSGVNWWQISLLNITGWIVEGDSNGYFVEPTIPGYNCAAPRLTLGAQGQPVIGAPNPIYGGPSAYNVAWSSFSLGELPDGGIFTVVGGPTCAENVNWWQITYNGITGWIMETTNGNALVLPYP